MADREEQLEVKLLQWLEQQGYPLEMRVAQAFRDAGLHVSQSDYYTDPESGDLREIDLWATHTLGFQQHSSYPFPVHVSFCIECKKTKHPWIIFTGDVNPFGADSYVTTDPHVADSEFRFPELPEDNLFSTEFMMRETVGYGVTEAFTTARDNAYAAMMTATKCAIAKIQPFDKRNRAGGMDHLAGLSFPVVVVDSRLYAVHLDQQNQLTIREIEVGIVLSPPLPYRGRDTVFGVRICTSKYIPVLAEQAILAARGINVRQTFDEHLAKIRSPNKTSLH